MKRKEHPSIGTSDHKRPCTFQVDTVVSPSNKQYTYEQVRAIVLEAISIRETQLQIEMNIFIQHQLEKRRPPPDYIS